MNLVPLSTGTPVRHANARLVHVDGLRLELESQVEGEIRFDATSRAL